MVPQPTLEESYGAVKERAKISKSLLTRNGAGKADPSGLDLEFKVQSLSRAMRGI